MATKSEINLVFGYGDESKRKLVIGPYAEMDQTALAGIKAKIKEFNASDVSVVSSLILSDGGASCTGIADASVTTTNSREINLND